jgi:hypothetical protein
LEVDVEPLHDIGERRERNCDRDLAAYLRHARSDPSQQYHFIAYVSS